MSHSVLAIIPARAGSKRLPHKNMHLFAGQPLIYWTIAVAQQTKIISDICVSSDSEEILNFARAQNIEHNLLRPPHLADDEASSEAVIAHVIEHSAAHEHIILLQPSSPLRQAGDIDAAFQLYMESKAKSCVSVTAQKSSSYCYVREQNQRLRHYDFSPYGEQDIVALNGAIYITSTRCFLETKNMIQNDVVGFEMPPERSIDIDYEWEFIAAEKLFYEQNLAGRKI